MPELPEVETIAHSLAQHIVGHKINHVRLNRRDLRFPFPPRFAANLKGQHITTITRRGKYLLTHLNNDTIWLTHLGMSGRFILNPQPHTAHLHLLCTLQQGLKFGYVDPRRFGYMTLYSASDSTQNRFLRSLGVEPMSRHLTNLWLYDKLRQRNAPIKNILLDQRIIAGLGNIYVCEALFRARIHPAHPAKDLTRTQLAHLIKHIRATLKDAIAAGGSSLKDFAHIDGTNGYFQHRFQIYGRAGASCRRPTCDAIIARIVQAGRTSFFCPNCQHSL